MVLRNCHLICHFYVHFGSYHSYWNSHPGSYENFIATHMIDLLLQRPPYSAVALRNFSLVRKIACNINICFPQLPCDIQQSLQHSSL